MVLSKREQIILIVAVVAVVILIGDRFILNPVLGELDQTEARKEQLKGELDNAQILFAQRVQMERRWRTMLPDDLRSAADAESKIVRAIHGWSQDARLLLSSVKPERVASDKGLDEMTFQVAGRGTLQAVAWFLWQIETAELPIKVRTMQLGSTNESGDSMSLQLLLSALYQGGPKKLPDQQPLQPQIPDPNEPALQEIPEPNDLAGQDVALPAQRNEPGEPNKPIVQETSSPSATPQGQTEPNEPTTAQPISPLQSQPRAGTNDENEPLQ